MNLYSFALIFALQMIGSVSHWISKKSRKEVVGSIIDYYLADYPGRSLSVIAVFAASSAAAASSSASAIIDPVMLWDQIVHYHTIPDVCVAAIGSALAWGWTFDSGINKGAKSE